MKITKKFIREFSIFIQRDKGQRIVVKEVSCNDCINDSMTIINRDSTNPCQRFQRFFKNFFKYREKNFKNILEMIKGVEENRSNGVG